MSCIEIDRSSALHAASDIGPRFRLLAIGGLLLCLGVGGCAQQPHEMKVSHGKEYFPSSVYGRASKRVIADGQPVPRGGGQYLVGKPYTIAGRTYVPTESRATQIGYGSWYGDAFHGRLTANGEIYDRDGFTAASPTMPLPSYARVTNLRNNYSMIVRVNDRGPYASDRIMDVSRRVAEALDYKRYGTAKLKVEYVGKASLSGSNDAKLYATLRVDQPTFSPVRPTLVAIAPSRARVASTVPYAPEADEVRPVSKFRQRDATQSPRSREGTETETETPYGKRAWRRLDPDGRDGAGSRMSRHRLTAYQEDAGDRPLRASGHAGRDEARHRGETVALRYERVAPTRHDRFDKLMPLSRPSGLSKEVVQLPPSRPMDLGTIPGAATQIRAHHEAPRQRLARSRDD